MKIHAYATPSRLDLAADVAAPLPTEILFMPAGQSMIHAGSADGAGYHGAVNLDAASAALVISSFSQLRADGHRAWIDENHANAAALGDVRAMRWEEGRGLIATVDWTPAGERALRDRTYCSFSPAFLISKETRSPVGLSAGEAVGGLVNAPAFGSRLQLIAAAQAPLSAVKPNPSADNSPAKIHAMNTIAQKLGLAETATEQEILAAIAALQDGPAKEALNCALAAQKKAESDVAAINAALKVEQDKAAAANAQLIAARASVVTSVEPKLIESVKAYAKADTATRSRIYAGGLGKQISESREVMQVLAANSLGTLTGELILQRALTLLKLQFPLLNAISSDYSSESSSYGQVIKTRTRGIPSVVTYNTTTGYASSDATTADVSLTINQHKAVQVEFNANEVASTMRDLFGEQVEGIQYAIGKNLMDAIYATITAGNFTNATTKGTASVARSTAISMAKALRARGVADMGRFLVLNQDTFEQLANDTTITSLGFTQRAELIEEYKLPPIAGFNIIEAVNLPGTGNLTGFAGTPDSLVLATRLPNDYTKALPGSGNGAVSTVTNPDTGISLAVTQFVDHTLGKAVWRAALMYGVGVGQGAAGQRLISA
jgi:phage I-like protein